MILTRVLHNSFRPVLRPSLPGNGSLKCSSIGPVSFATKASSSSGNKAKKTTPAATAKKVSTGSRTKKTAAAAVPAAVPAAPAAAAVKVISPGKKKAPVAAKAPVTKRPLSAYSIFLRNEYNKVKEQSPELKFTEISKKLGDLWRELPNDQKAKYLREAEKAQAIAKAKEGPKAPPNAYAVFAKEMYKSTKSENPELGFGELSRKIAELWRGLPKLEKAARQDRYRQKLDQFKKASATASASTP